MACKHGFCQEEGDGDSDAPRFYSDPLLLFLFGDLVSAPTASLSVVLKPPARRRSAVMMLFLLALMKLRQFSFFYSSL